MAPNPIILYVTILATLCIKGLNVRKNDAVKYGDEAVVSATMHSLQTCSAIDEQIDDDNDASFSHKALFTKKW